MTPKITFLKACCQAAGFSLILGLAAMPGRTAEPVGAGGLVFHDPLESADGGPDGRKISPAGLEFVPGKVGNCAHFMAGNRGIGYPVELIPFNEGTIEFWVSFDDPPSSIQQKRVLFQYSTDDSKKNFFALFHGGEKDWGKELILLICDGKEQRFQISRALADWGANEWHHVAVTWKLNAEKESSIALYLDRELVQQQGNLTIMQDREAIDMKKNDREFGYLWLGLPGPGVGLKIDEFKVYKIQREYSSVGGK